MPGVPRATAIAFRMTRAGRTDWRVAMSTVASQPEHSRKIRSRSSVDVEPVLTLADCARDGTDPSRGSVPPISPPPASSCPEALRVLFTGSPCMCGSSWISKRSMPKAVDSAKRVRRQSTLSCHEAVAWVHRAVRQNFPTKLATWEGEACSASLT
eukprot:scaffold79891_cov32-Tisochrysis_lutea.AAC.3